MPFVEHRGGGKQGRMIDSMQSRWDTEWSSAGRENGVPDLTAHENWQWVREKIQPPARVLEAGCGFAQWVAFLDAQGYETHGLDYSCVAIQRSLAVWPHLRLVRGDLRHMPYENDFFDGIVSFGAIEHDINGPADALADMYRVLRPGGVMYCTVPCMNRVRRLGVLALRDWAVCNPIIRRLAGRKQDVGFYQYVHTPKEYVEALEAAGFELVDLVPLNPRAAIAQGGFRRRAAMSIHRYRPWWLAHSMGAICRKSS